MFSFQVNGFQPNLISNLERPVRFFVPCFSFFLNILCIFNCCFDLLLGFTNVLKVIICCWRIAISVWLFASRMESEQCFEWRFLGYGMGSVIVHEFSQWQPFIPVILFVIDEVSEVGCCFLMAAFNLSIHLWVVCCGQILFDLQHATQCFCEHVLELWSLV